MWPRLLSGILTAALLFAANAIGRPSAVDASNQTLFEIFETLEQFSRRTHRQPLASPPNAPVDPDVFTRMQRHNSSGSISNSNATIIAADSCRLLVAAAGHSVLDFRYEREVARGALRVLLPGGKWASPEEVVTPETLEWSSDERDDWALLVVRHPDCSFADNNSGEPPHPHLPTTAVGQSQLEQCRNRVQLLCHHFDQGREDGQLMLETGCSLRTKRHPPTSGDGPTNTTGYFSCKMDSGSSGCAVLCKQDQQWLNLGIFSKGLKRHDEVAHPQRVGAFRVIDGELAREIERLKEKYGME